jgi:hypothetical protein
VKEKIQALGATFLPVLFLAVVITGLVCAYKGDADAAEKCFAFAGGQLVLSPIAAIAKARKRAAEHGQA